MLSKDCLVSFWLSLVVSFVLWYRNANYDRTMAPYIFMLGFLQLIMYGYHNTANKSQVAKALLVSNALAGLVLSVSVALTVSSSLQMIAWYLSFFAFLLFISVCIYVCTDQTFSIIDNDGLQITVNNVPLSPWISLIFLAPIIFALVILNYSYSWENLSLIGLLVFTVVVGLYQLPTYLCGFSYYSVIFCLITWASTLNI